MKGLVESFVHFLIGEPQVTRIVPPHGFTVWLTSLTAASMAFLAIFALSFSVAAGRVADDWSTELARTQTIRVAAPEVQIEAQTQTVLEILRTTPGIESYRIIEADEQRQLLAPWFGSDIPIEELPVPHLVELIEAPSGFDREGLTLRLVAEAPGAVLDDHRRWRAPLVQATNRLRVLGGIAIILIGCATAAMVTLAAQSALSANHQVIRVLRLIGARDHYIAGAFVRRFTLRCFSGAFFGTTLGLVALLLMPNLKEEAGVLFELSFQGWVWILPISVPMLAAVVAFFATRMAAKRVLGRLS